MEEAVEMTRRGDECGKSIVRMLQLEKWKLRTVKWQKLKN